jgi:hypothetical protein
MAAALGFLDDGESLDFSHLEPAPKFADLERASPALHGVASEIATLAGSIATVASLFNASEISPVADRKHVLAIMPSEPVVYPAVISALANLQPELIGQIQHFHVRLAFARKATVANLQAAPASVRSDYGITADVLADIWRELCQSAIDILDKAVARGVELDQQSTRLPRLRNILTRAAAGESPCIMADGTIEIPGIAERRQQPRYSVSWQAWLQAEGDWQPITLFDISRGGIGAEAAIGVTAGQTVNLVVGDHNLQGKIAWASTGRFAVQFDGPLAHDDNLLVAARSQNTIA